MEGMDGNQRECCLVVKE